MMLKPFGLFIILILSIAGCRRSHESSDNQQNDDDVVLTEEQAKVLITPTIYNIALHDGVNADCAASDLRDMKTPEGIYLAKVCPTFFAKCLMQGSCKVLVGDHFQLLHYSPLKTGEARFSKVDEDICRYSYGANQVCVDPFYSVAAELSKYKAGTVIFIPGIVGLLLPNGGLHNGYFVVRDSGSRIKGYGRFDFFTGYYPLDRSQNPFVQLGLAWKGTHLPYSIIDGDVALQILNSRKYPKIPE